MKRTEKKKSKGKFNSVVLNSTSLGVMLGKATVAYTMPQQRKKEESERL